MRGWFITFEGPDGSGKTTQLRLMAPWLASQNLPILVTREPGGTPVGERIREILHDCQHTEMTSEAEILLYSASRAQHVGEIIRPAVAAGKIVLCDRFYDSTYAYQGYGRGLSLPALRQITAFATQGLVPDLTLYLDVPPEVGIARREASGEALNRLDREALAFHRRVREGYQALIEAEPSRWRCINATGAPSAIQATLREIVMATISERSTSEECGL
jgi:dTMP kinase